LCLDESKKPGKVEDGNANERIHQIFNPVIFYVLVPVKVLLPPPEKYPSMHDVGMGFCAL